MTKNKEIKAGKDYKHSHGITKKLLEKYKANQNAIPIAIRNQNIEEEKAV